MDTDLKEWGLNASCNPMKRYVNTDQLMNMCHNVVASLTAAMHLWLMAQSERLSD